METQDTYDAYIGLDVHKKMAQYVDVYCVFLSVSAPFLRHGENCANKKGLAIMLSL
jgi:hypothetical protein